MKKLAKFFILSISILSLVSIYSCSNESYEIPTNSSVISEYSDMIIPNFNDKIWDEVVGGTIDKEFNINSLKSSNTLSNNKKASIQSEDDDEESDCEDEGDDDSDSDDHDGEEHDSDEEDDGCCYGSILSKLNLTVDQVSQIHQFKDGFEDCVELTEDSYESAKETIIENANQQRNEILQQFANGTISKTQVEELLQNLKTSVLQQITDLKTVFQSSAADCLCTYLMNIISVLDDLQKETFITWVESSSCVNTNCDLRGTSTNQQ